MIILGDFFLEINMYLMFYQLYFLSYICNTLNALQNKQMKNNEIKLRHIIRLGDF